MTVTNNSYTLEDIKDFWQSNRAVWGHGDMPSECYAVIALPYDGEKYDGTLYHSDGGYYDLYPTLRGFNIARKQQAKQVAEFEAANPGKTLPKQVYMKATITWEVIKEE